MGLRQTIRPSVEPVTLAEAKLHFRVDFADDDSLISRIVAAARHQVETDTGRQLIPAQWTLTLDRFPLTWDGGINYGGTGGPGGEPYRPDWNGMVIPRPPLIAVNSIQYVDPNGVTQTWSNTLYRVDSQSEPARVTPEYGQIYPVPRIVINAVTVQYWAGYGDTWIVSGGYLFPQSGTYSLGDVVRFSTIQGSLPAGLSQGVDYYIVATLGSLFKVSSSQGGPAITLSDPGTGTLFLLRVPDGIRSAILLLANHWYENREAVGMGQMNGVPLAYESLVTDFSTGQYYSLN
jgi:hypothetical protein